MGSETLEVDWLPSIPNSKLSEVSIGFFMSHNDELCLIRRTSAEWSICCKQVLTHLVETYMYIDWLGHAAFFLCEKVLPQHRFVLIRWFGLFKHFISLEAVTNWTHHHLSVLWIIRKSVTNLHFWTLEILYKMIFVHHTLKSAISVKSAVKLCNSFASACKKLKSFLCQKNVSRTHHI